MVLTLAPVTSARRLSASSPLSRIREATTVSATSSTSAAGTTSLMASLSSSLACSAPLASTESRASLMRCAVSTALLTASGVISARLASRSTRSCLAAIELDSRFLLAASKASVVLVMSSSIFASVSCSSGESFSFSATAKRRWFSLDKRSCRVSLIPANWYRVSFTLLKPRVTSPCLIACATALSVRGLVTAL